MTVLFTSRRTTLKASKEHTAAAMRELYQYVMDLDLLICGPQYRFFYGMDGRPDAPLTMEIALPVQGQIPTALLPFFKQVPPFRCLAARVEGPWEDLVGEYQRLLRHISDNDLKMNGIYVEKLLHIDLLSPVDQITEIQVGLCEPTPGYVRPFRYIAENIPQLP